MLTKYEIEESEIDKVVEKEKDEYIGLAEFGSTAEVTYELSPDGYRIVGRTIDGVNILEQTATEIRINPIRMSYSGPIDISGQFSTPISYDLPKNLF